MCALRKYLGDAVASPAQTVTKVRLAASSPLPVLLEDRLLPGLRPGSSISDDNMFAGWGHARARI